MCGIVGVFAGYNKSLANLEDDVLKMGAAIAHRGPDSHGSWVDNESRVAMAHRRLAILDLSSAGHQPMHSASGRYVIVFNGEIYNHLELRRELESISSHSYTMSEPIFPKEKVNWRGHSDTETLLAGFDAWGIEATIKRAVGMFAIAVWDRRERILSLVRDRLGEKPLYYGWCDGVFLFCSELKALLAYTGFRADIDRNALSLFLKYNYVPSPYSIYQKIYKLWPGTILSVKVDATSNCPWSLAPPFPPFVFNGVCLTRFWSLADTVEQDVNASFPSSEREMTDELEKLLRQAVAGQMISDVPLGAFLSGGVDSSVIVALMQAQTSQRVKTFTIGFHESGFNEAEHAKKVARHLGTEHIECYVTPAAALDVIPRLPSLYDEPFADSSQIPTFLISRLARQNVTVALSGDAGDELFGGYNRYSWVNSIWRKTGWLPRKSRQLLAHGMAAVPARCIDRLYNGVSSWLPDDWQVSLPIDKAYKMADALAEDSPEDIYLRLVSHWKNPSDVVIGSTEPKTILTDRCQWSTQPVFEQQMMFLDTMTYLPDDILVKVDRAAMGVSLETRVPFLDHRVVEFTSRLPMSMKISDSQNKWILRQVLYKYVPKKMIDRPKSGFAVPLDTWLRGPLRDWTEELLAERRLEEDGFFQSKSIQKKWHEHLSGKRNWQHHLWSVLMFQAWRENATS